MTSVLLAYDGSAAAAAAVRAVGALLPGANGIALNVRPAPVTADAARIALPDDVIAGALQALERAAADHAAAFADEGARAAAEAGVDAEPRVAIGADGVWRAIRDVAAETGMDLVTCGSRGLGAPSRLALGSTSSGLLHHADRPLLVVPRFDAGAPAPVLIGYDGSQPSRDAIGVAGPLLGDRTAIVVTVWESLIRHSLGGRWLAALPAEDMRTFTRDLDAYYRDVALDVAREGAALAREAGLAAEPAERESGGSAWHGLLAYARERSASVLVVGARGRGGLPSALLGSVSSGLVHHADRPVLVIPAANH